jgi:manganese transport protein
MFTSNKNTMGILVNRRVTTFLTGLIAALIIVLNVYLLIQIFTGG